MGFQNNIFNTIHYWAEQSKFSVRPKNSLCSFSLHISLRNVYYIFLITKIPKGHAETNIQNNLTSGYSYLRKTAYTILSLSLNQFLAFFKCLKLHYLKSCTCTGMNTVCNVQPMDYMIKFGINLITRICHII